MQVKSTIIIILVLAATVSSFAANKDSVYIGWDDNSFKSIDNNISIGLALSGGGARGLSQVGILRAFEESGYDITAIAGTSIGGIIGGLYASGYKAADLDSIVRKIDFMKLFSNRPGRTTMFLTSRSERERSILSIRLDGFRPYIPQALTAGQKLTDLLTRLTLKANYRSNCDFSRLSIPFLAVTTDIVHGRKYLFDHGNLSDAMRATMAFPLAFTGVDQDSMILMDGGMVDPIPSDIVRSMSSDLDLIIAVNTASDLLDKDQISDPIDIANQVTSIMTIDKLRAGLDLADIVIEPEISGYSSTSFDQIDSLIERGYRAGLDAVRQIDSIIFHRGDDDTLFIEEVDFTLHGMVKPVNFPFYRGQFLTKQMIGILAKDYYRDAGLFSLSIKPEESGYLAGTFAKVHLHVTITARPRLSDLQYEITGNTVIENQDILAILANGDSLLSSEKILTFSDSLTTLYENKGYDLAHIRSLRYQPDESKLYLDIDEALVRDIVITGNDKTKTWLIANNFGLSRGKPFSSRKASRGIANIYGTDLFDRVTMNVVPVDSGALVQVNVVEKKYTQFRFGWHWHDEYESEQFIEMLYDNLLGTGQELLGHFQYARRRQEYYLYLKADQFFGTSLTYRLQGFYGILERNNYDPDGNYLQTFRESRIGGEFVLGRQISRFGTVTGEMRFEEIKNDIIGGGVDRIQLRSITFRSHVETFNRLPFTTEGKRHLFYITFANDILGGETEFTKLYSSIESYFPITDYLNFHPRVAFGYIDTKFGIPSSERFYMGGHYSMYGYRTDELVGAKMFLANMELRAKLPFRLYLSARYDTGDIWSSVDQIKLKKLRHAFGFSLAYDSPIGPVDLGWGMSEDRDRFYVDIGFRF